MITVGLFYGSSSGKTEKIAGLIKESLSKYAEVEVFDIAEVNQVDLTKYSLLIFGVPTWGIGRLQDDWLRFIVNNPQADLSRTCIAFFGLGDQDGYPNTYNDGMGILYEAYKSGRFIHVGRWPVEDYIFEASKAIENNQFIGLALDEDNEPGKSKERIETWIKQVIQESRKYFVI